MDKRQLTEKIKAIADQYDDSEDVEYKPGVTAILTLEEDNLTYSIPESFLKKIFQNVETVKSFLTVFRDPSTVSLELFKIRLPDESLLELENNFAMVEEV